MSTIRHLKFCNAIRGNLIVIAALFLTACNTAIKESDRDTDSVFRGVWDARVEETPTDYRPGQVWLKCWNMETSAVLTISDGRVVVRLFNRSLRGFVNSNGKVTAEINLGKSDFGASASRSFVGDHKFIVKATLDATTGTGTGRLIHGFKDFGYQGCSSAVKFRMRNPPKTKSDPTLVEMTKPGWLRGHTLTTVAAVDTLTEIESN